MAGEASTSWVAARSRCTAADVFETLRGEVKASVLDRNAILDASGDRGRFSFKERLPNGFTVYDTWTRSRRAVDFDVKDNTITIRGTGDSNPVSLDATVTLNDLKQCRLLVKKAELEPWQVAKRALEALFFEWVATT